MIRKIAQAMAKTNFAAKAMEENAGLNAIKEKRPTRLFGGMFLMVMSYIIGWPMIALFGVLAIYWNEPLMIIVGGPLLFGLAHVAFLAGLYLAGGKYIMPFIRWATRITLEKLG
jgi:hypothetical protein